jgi:hypothetical protein
LEQPEAQGYPANIPEAQEKEKEKRKRKIIAFEI